MSYAKAMKWAKKHPKGTRQPVLMHTNSGFWPSGSYLKDYWKYADACAAEGVKPFGCEQFYRAITKKGHIPRTVPDYVAMTKAGTLGI